jgi:hypothetical protein
MTRSRRHLKPEIPVKAKLLLLSLPLAAALAMVTQDPAEPKGQEPEEPAAIMSMSEMQYTDLQGKTTVVAARNVVEIRLLADVLDHVRLELLYENGDYSMIDAQALHLLRNGTPTREVRIVRARGSNTRFPRLP